jgi:prolyl-tRNA editing enzyme YbaK/EbsC (Cys-tRNA(Pro) deacylase)
VRTSVDVHNYLIEREVPHEVFSARGRLRSPERLAAVLDLPPDQVGKVVVFEGPKATVAAVVPAGTAADVAKVRQAAGNKQLSPATNERASELTEYLAESVPPVGLPNGFALVVDRSLDRDDVLYFPGGEARSVLKIRGRDLVLATDARVASIVSEHRPEERRGSRGTPS